MAKIAKRFSCGNWACLWLVVASLALSSSRLFADHDDPPVFDFKDCSPPHGSNDIAPGVQANPSYYRPTAFVFKDYPTPQSAEPTQSEVTVKTTTISTSRASYSTK